MPRGVKGGIRAAERRRMESEEFLKKINDEAIQQRIRATDNYYHRAIEQTNDFLEFLFERVEFYSEFQVEVIVFMNAYNQWRKNRKIKDSVHIFQRDIILRSFGVKKSAESLYLGIQLKKGGI